jgi:hypothetical protein
MREASADERRGHATHGPSCCSNEASTNRKSTYVAAMDEIVTFKPLINKFTKYIPRGTDRVRRFMAEVCKLV